MLPHRERAVLHLPFCMDSGPDPAVSYAVYQSCCRSPRDREDVEPALPHMLLGRL